MLRETVSPVTVDEHGGVIPDLQDDQGSQQILDHQFAGDKALGDGEQGIVAADDADENEVVDEFEILDLFYLVLAEKGVEYGNHKDASFCAPKKRL